ncbi:MAG: hypothetical protein OJJ21_11090 [Ferrovibrio sp.]|uniref:hypothetical protein n=1 Tax=Ferrovibrio sp. TaxID=1917215 RepID=UPI0026147793|nr:hypothetical protein [Ferrovibrio sp.]MCW0234135.1 hypothetical protein [Ferrovibrio sp.]
MSSMPKRLHQQVAASYTTLTANDLVAITPTGRTDDVVVIGHGTLPVFLALLNRGCRHAAELRVDVVAPHAEHADLAWITGISEPKDCDNAVKMALRRVGKSGRVAIDATVLVARKGMQRLIRYMKRLGLHVDSTHCVGTRIVLLAHG